MPLVRNLQGKKPLKTSRCDCNSGIEMDPREIGFEVMEVGWTD
jgi:hypothetical protein